MNSAGDSLSIVAQVSNEILERLEKTVSMQSQIVSVEDKLTMTATKTNKNKRWKGLDKGRVWGKI